MTNGQAIFNFDLCSILATTLPTEEKGNISAWALVKFSNLGKLAQGLRMEHEGIKKIDDSEESAKEFLNAEYAGSFLPIPEDMISRLGVYNILVKQTSGEDTKDVTLDSLYILSLLSENGIIK
jgi:hypothetical protein